MEDPPSTPALLIGNPPATLPHLIPAPASPPLLIVDHPAIPPLLIPAPDSPPLLIANPPAIPPPLIPAPATPPHLMDLVFLRQLLPSNQSADRFPGQSVPKSDLLHSPK